MPEKLGPVPRLGPASESVLRLGPRWALEMGLGSRSVFALKLGPGVKQMTTPEPKSNCELGSGPSEQEPEGVLEPEKASELDPVVVLVPETASGLELVPGVMQESVTMSELERARGGSLFPERGSEMETSRQEWVLKLGARLVLVQKPGLAEVMEPWLVP